MDIEQIERELWAYDMKWRAYIAKLTEHDSYHHPEVCAAALRWDACREQVLDACRLAVSAEVQPDGA